ncbi:hypothetical protein N7449_009328 [Penicillium cf. viridicatum]|uniref:Secreted protein n=1 Tax=Penicillium cf. viridicatum TaxID=2972119 RepID=A0A9W9JF47_9EURO|nr:hypothetical protein N7449_009328 [Penicillium cf. viridicatum]
MRFTIAPLVVALATTTKVQSLAEGVLLARSPVFQFPDAYLKKHTETNQSASALYLRLVTLEDSLVVTHPTTNSPACGLSTAERTGSPIFHTLWSYVLA